MKSYYINGLTRDEVNNLIEDLKTQGYKIFETQLGRYKGTIQYYGDIFYGKV